MPDDERATLQAAITSSLAQLATPIPVPHKPQKPTSYNGKVDAIATFYPKTGSWPRLPVYVKLCFRLCDLERVSRVWRLGSIT